jgi:hypothetical protein
MVQAKRSTRMILKMKKILSPLLGQELTYSHNDCNYVFLLVHEPEIAECLHGRYTTVMGGCRVAKKETGFSTIRQLIVELSNYIEVDKRKYTTGDIMVFDDCHEVALVTNRNYYGFNEDNIYCVRPMSNVGQPFKLYRKI